MTLRPIRYWLASRILSLGEALSRPAGRRRIVLVFSASAAAILAAVFAYDANGSTAIGTKPSIQRATTW